MLAGAEDSGRETLAHRLVDAHGFVRCCLLDHAKDICTDLLDRMQCRVERRFFDDPELQNQMIMDMDGNIFDFQSGSQSFPLTYDQFLKRFAERTADHVHKYIWIFSVKSFVTRVITTSPYRGVVIPDFQKPEEHEELYRFVMRYGGIIDLSTIQIIRPGTIVQDFHPLRDFRFTLGVKNDGTIADLFVKADKIATGQWQLDKYMHEVKQRQEHGILQQIKKAAEAKEER